MNSNTARTICFSISMGVIWFALILQFILGMKLWVGHGMSEVSAVVQYFSYFTILSNLLAAISISSLLIYSTHSTVFFVRPKVVTAIAVYITIVGLGYAFLLRHLWNPQGLQWVADELLHSVNPVLFVLVWIFFIRKNDLEHKDLLKWLIFPAGYLIYILIRGALTDSYPYPFIDAGQLGYPKALSYALALTAAFVVVADVFVLIGKWMRK